MKLRKLSYKKKNKKGFAIMINLLMAFIAITTLIAFLPGFVSLLDTGLGSGSLNCAGYVDSDLSDGNQSYNATIGTKSAIGCLSLKLYIPYIVLGVLIAVVAKIFYGQSMGGQQQQMYG